MVLPYGLTRRSYQTVLTNFRTFFHVLVGCFLFYNIVSCFRISFSCFRISFSVLEHPFLLQNVLSVLEQPKNCGKIVEKNVNLQKVWVARVWCVTSLKVPARTHIAHMFKKSFRTHTHTCDRTSHTCVRARTFATHGLHLAVLTWSSLISQKIKSPDHKYFLN